VSASDSFDKNVLYVCELWWNGLAARAVTPMLKRGRVDLAPERKTPRG
jgi:hypothetical protein